MLIEQISKLRGSGTPGRICTPITGCFHDKTIIPKENIQLDWHLLQNIAGGNALYYLGQITYKI